MFDFVRNRQRLMQIVLLVLIVPSFAFFGLEGYQRFRENPRGLVKVDEQLITQDELDNAMRSQLAQLRQMMGASFDAKQFDTPQGRQIMLDRLIEEKLLGVEVIRQNLSVSDAHLLETVQNIPAIAALKKPDGTFDLETFKQLLAAQGMTPEQFDANVRFQLVNQQLADSILTTAWVPTSLAERISASREQEREVQPWVFRAQDYAGTVAPTAEQLKAWYEQHSEQFQIPEQAKVEYIVLSLQKLAEGIQPTEDELKAYYEQNLARFKTAERRRASHILVTVAKDAPSAQREAAKAKAEKLLQDVRANPAKFAEIAKANSQDPGSAASGGDLGTFGRGAMVKPFEDAVYQLKQGEISNLVETDFGYHIILVTEVHAAETQALQAVREEVLDQVKNEKANKLFSEQADVLTNTVFDQSDSLKPAADKLKLAIQTAEHVMRQGNPSLGAESPLNTPRLLSAVFSDEAIKSKRNTEAIQVEPGVLVAARIQTYQPTSRQSFEQAETLVRQQVIAEAAYAQAKKAGQDKLAELQKSPDAAGFAAAQRVSFVNPQGLPTVALTEIMKANVSKLPVVVGVVLPGEGYALYKIGKVQQPENVDTARRAAEAQQLLQATAKAEFRAYLASLRARTKVKILHALPGDTASQPSAGA